MKTWRDTCGAASFLTLIAVAVLTALALPAQAKTGTYRVALLHVSYSNTAPSYSLAQLTQAAAEIRSFFNNLSYGQLDVQISPVDVNLSNTREFYNEQCQASGETRNPCPPPLIEDAAQAAAAANFNFTGIDGIGVLNTFDAQRIGPTDQSPSRGPG